MIWWPHRSRDISCPILNSAKSTASTILRMSLKRLELTLLIIIYIFVGIKIIVRCSAHVCKWEAKIVSKEMLYQPKLTYISLGICHPMSAWRSYRRWTFIHNLIGMEWCSDKRGFIRPLSRMELAAGGLFVLTGTLNQAPPCSIHLWP